jgi:type IV pilus assembly protein PilY1
VRYFSGRGAPTAAFNIAASGNADAELGLTRATWDNPYAAGKPTCAKPFMTVVSDINPSYDTDRVPGSAFNAFSGDLATLDAAARGDTIWANEFGGPGNHFIGQSGTGPAGYDGAPSPKIVTSFGNIRGLAPEEPTKQGGYYAASVAYWAATNDVNPAPGMQRVETFAVALASPLPRIEIPVGPGQKVTLVPFAKSVGGCLGVVGTQGQFQPTNTIVDFYVESVAADGSSGSFRVNFEDVEQGADHDMDAIVRYTYQVVAGQVQVQMQSLYAAGCIIQHMGYVISGTTSDGTYLEVRDLDTGAGSDPDYFLDTPNGTVIWNDGAPLPLTSTRLFTPGSASGATLLKDPLWFAAKWGGFQDLNENGLPDLREEWDVDLPGSPGRDTPDNYFLVTNALYLKTQLGKAFDALLQRTFSTSAAAVNSGTIQSNTKFYQSEFSSVVWSGNLRARPILADGSFGTLSWTASSELPGHDARKIATRNTGGATVPFRWASLDSGRQAALTPEGVPATGQQRVDWLRGDRAQERRNGGAFRDRDPLSVLGDFINSTPVYVGKPSRRFRDSLESAAYSSFKTTYATRDPMIYMGGNDGMFHAFDAETGEEKWAFIPSSAFNRLKGLTDVNFQHKFLLDGSPAISDAFWTGTWKTVAVTAQGFGGQSLFAMDVTDPTAATETAVGGKFLWEFTDLVDTDIGYVTGRPVIARMKNGKWAAIFGNGYNNTVPDGRASTTGNGVLYVVDLETGAIIRKFDTRVGMAADPLGLSRPNGLAAPGVVDINDDDIADFIYVGDLFGNLWKIDVTSTTATSWAFSFVDAGSNPLPLHIARNAGGGVQPITSRPTIGRAPYGVGNMVYFGTGKFLELQDRVVASLTTQSLYGIIDRNTGTTADRVLGRAALTQQTIDVETAASFGGDPVDVRITSNNPLGANRGWYLDLILPGPVFQGEMQITDSVLRNGRIFFTTLVPNPDPCGLGGDSWLFTLDALSGGRLDSTFDLDGDGEFTNQDLLDQSGTNVALSGVKSGAGIAPRSTIITDGKIDLVILPGTNPAPPSALPTEPPAGQTFTIATDPGLGAYGRQSWRQLR